MKKLLQELKTFKLYGKQYLDKSLYKEYKEYLCEKILNELTAKGLANTFKYIFKNNVKNNSKATVDEINKFKKSILNVSYKTKFGEVVKDVSTNLSINNAFCKKETFIKEFKKENFDEFKNKKDLALEDTLDTFLNDFLELYDKNGWLKLENYREKNQGC